MADGTLTMPDEVVDLYSFPPADADEARYILRELDWGDRKSVV